MDIKSIYPVLYIPKQCTRLDIKCDISENVFLDMTMFSPDTEGNDVCIYSGYCNVKLIDSPEKDTSLGDYRLEVLSPGHEDSNSLDCHDISQMPVILADTNQTPFPYTQSQVWIDPSTSPYVYNQYDTLSKKVYPIRETNRITVQQHNTYITQNVFNYNETRSDHHPNKTFQQTRYTENAEQTIRQESNFYESNEGDRFSNNFEDISNTRLPQDENYFDDEFDSDSFLSQIAFAKENNAKKNKSQQHKSARTDIKRDDLHKCKAKQQSNFAISENSNASVSKSVQLNYSESRSDALKQLMSTSTPSSAKQRKTILYLGNDPSSGETIQNMSYVDPTIKCSEIEVDHEVVIENSPSTATNKKKYRCDKCQTIFSQIAAYRRHVTKHNTTQTEIRSKSYQCYECGKNMKDYNKFQRHCQGHGDPDLECSKCHKVYASNASMKAHQKIHKRRYPCEHCKRTYATFQTYKTHLRKAHNKCLYECEDCTFKTNIESAFYDHTNDHINCDENDYMIKVRDQNDDVNDRELRKKKRCQNDGIEDIDDGINDLDHINEENSKKSYIHKDYNTNQQIDHQFHVTEKMEITQDHTNGQTNDDQINENQVNDDQPNDDHTEEVFNNSSDTDMADSLAEVFSDSEFDKNSVFLDDVVKTENEMSFEEDEVRDKIKEADSVIAKVMSNKIFLLNAKNAKKQARKYKSCQVCSKSFDRASDLKRHLIEHIVKSTLAKAVSSAQGFLDIDCEICHTETFDSIDKYKAHLREHAKLTIYKCTFCDKTFSDSSNFSKHKKIHGNSYYQCDLCRRKFNSKTMITRHMEYHNKNKPLQCKYCDRLFHFQSMLTKHMRAAHRSVTSKFNCRFCDEIFKTLKAKWDHEWVVHNIRKLIVDCEICGSKFRKFMELKRHCVDYHGIQIRSVKSLKRKKEKMDYYEY